MKDALLSKLIFHSVGCKALLPLDLLIIVHLQVDEENVLQKLCGHEVILLLSQHLQTCTRELSLNQNRRNTYAVKFQEYSGLRKMVDCSNFPHPSHASTELQQRSQKKPLIV